MNINYLLSVFEHDVQSNCCQNINIQTFIVDILFEYINDYVF